jgi:micrococcal nuclease
VLLAGCGGPTDAPGTGARVDSVRDGDTILLADGRRVRLVQVDAPELGVECYGDEALAELGRLVAEGDELRLERDPALDASDRHGRLLRYVHVAGVNVNVELVRRGAAAPYFYRGERGRYARRLLAAAEEARAGRRGLWAACPAARLEPSRAVASGPPA